MAPFNFASASVATVDPEVDKLQRDFAALKTRLGGVVACIPDETGDAVEDRIQWLWQWKVLSSDLSVCSTARLAKGLPFDFSEAEVASGNTANAAFDRFTAELKAIEEKKARQATEEAARKTAEAEAARSADVEEEEAPVRAPRQDGKRKRSEAVVESDDEDVADKEIVVQRKTPGIAPKHATRCVKCAQTDRDCFGFPRVACNGCKKLKVGCIHSNRKKRRVQAAPTPPVPSSSRSGTIRRPKSTVSPPIVLSDSDGDAESVISKAPASPKHKEAEESDDEEEDEVEEEICGADKEFPSLANSGLGDEEVAIRGEIRRLRAKAYQANALMMEVANGLDLIEYRLNRRRT
ncbi:hypothetical protein DEU56DRAFT_915154 [Suillus clintonianus]|uniref:uncharacterized protein n=1 Tax=Suillus clintonianus TaxID=1904413 RepID=UPI001B85D5DE|nr:uncharacterized protein DEU56DRAFT_915154 [Suillus clintonianus]KAG2129436.1 hypothetical protein DEU56DRAFT_915154 [Suillus clintonianus]